MKRVSSTASELQDFTEEEDGEKVYHVSKSRLMSLVDWFQVVSTYLPLICYMLGAVLIGQLLYSLYENRFDLDKFMTNEILSFEIPRTLAIDFGWKTVGLILLALWYLTYSQKPVYLMDFTTFEPPEDWKVSPEQLVQILQNQGCYTPESIEFLAKMLQRSGCGPSTAWPPGILRCLTGEASDRSAEAARKESEVRFNSSLCYIYIPFPPSHPLSNTNEPSLSTPSFLISSLSTIDCNLRLCEKAVGKNQHQSL